LLHISEVSWKRLDSLEGVMKEGDKVKIKLVGTDPKTGKLRLSRKVLMPKPEGYVEPEKREGGDRGDRRGGGDRGDRRNSGGGNRDRGDRNDRGERRDRPQHNNGNGGEQKQATSEQQPAAPQADDNDADLAL